MSRLLSAPFPGLPGRLPAGERVLWRGKPDGWLLARRALHLPGLGLYFGIILMWCLVSEIRGGEALAQVAASMLRLGLIAAAPIALLSLFALLVARTTQYTITNRRVVLRIGIALPRTLNLPFARIDEAALKLHPDGSGDLALRLQAKERLPFLLLWPHTRPWRLGRAQPSLRAVRDAAAAARVLSRALASAAELPVPVLAPHADIAGARPHAPAAA